MAVAVAALFSGPIQSAAAQIRARDLADIIKLQAQYFQHFQSLQFETTRTIYCADAMAVWAKHLLSKELQFPLDISQSFGLQGERYYSISITPEYSPFSITAAHYDGRYYLTALSEHRKVKRSANWSGGADPMGYYHDNPFVLPFSWTRDDLCEYSFRSMCNTEYWEQRFDGQILSEDLETIEAEFRNARADWFRVTFAKKAGYFPIKVVESSATREEFQPTLSCSVLETTETVLRGNRVILPAVIRYTIGEDLSKPKLDCTYRFSNYRLNTKIREAAFTFKEYIPGYIISRMDSGREDFSQNDPQVLEEWKTWFDRGMKRANLQFQARKLLTEKRKAAQQRLR